MYSLTLFSGSTTFIGSKLEDSRSSPWSKWERNHSPLHTLAYSQAQDDCQFSYCCRHCAYLLMLPIYFDITSISSTHYTAFASMISSFEHANQP
jgi:hypothetical protein